MKKSSIHSRTQSNQINNYAKTLQMNRSHFNMDMTINAEIRRPLRRMFPNMNHETYQRPPRYSKRKISGPLSHLDSSLVPIEY